MILYRGYKSKYQSYASRGSFIWLTDDPDYAMWYGDSLAVFEVDERRLKKIKLQAIDLILGYNFNEKKPVEEEVEKIRKTGANYYSFPEIGIKDEPLCLCLLDKSLLKEVWDSKDGKTREFFEKVKIKGI